MNIQQHITQTSLRILSVLLMGLLYLGLWVLRVLVIVVSGSLLLALSLPDLWNKNPARLPSP